MRAFLVSLALCLSGAAYAQFVGPSLELDFGGQTSRVLTAADCGGQVSVTWTANSGGNLPCSDITLWVTTATTCADAPGASDIQLSGSGLGANTWPTQRTGTALIDVNSLPVFASSSTDADGGTTITTKCSDALLERDMLVCGSFKYGNTFSGCSSSATVAKPSSPPTLRFDDVPPPAPDLGEIVPLDSALQVAASAATSDTILIHLEYRRAGDADFVSGGSFGTDRTSGKITGLENGVPYEVRARGEDQAGNIGPPSDVQISVPVHTQGFFDRYKQAGGEETGGCAAGAGGPLLGLGGALLAGFFFSRRRRG